MKTFVSRRALVCGATGLVGRALLAQLLTDARYGEVHVLLRTSSGAPPAHLRLSCHRVDFERLPEPLPAVDDVYCCIGTTLAAAGSKAAFRAVDHDIVVAVARAARRNGAERLAVVSAAGADQRSALFYPRVKGEMEQAVAQLGYACVVIARPALLDGDRAATGQPRRNAERLALSLLSPLAGLLPRAWRPIGAAVVARALREALAATPAGVRVIESAQLHSLGA